jgi:hypothetical protein
MMEFDLAQPVDIDQIVLAPATGRKIAARASEGATFCVWNWSIH